MPKLLDVLSNALDQNDTTTITRVATDLGAYALEGRSDVHPLLLGVARFLEQCPPDGTVNALRASIIAFQTLDADSSLALQALEIVRRCFKSEYVCPKKERTAHWITLAQNITNAQQPGVVMTYHFPAYQLPSIEQTRRFLIKPE